MLRTGSFMEEGTGLKSRSKNEALSCRRRGPSVPIYRSKQRAREKEGEPHKIAILPREKPVVQDNRSTSRLV